MNHRDDLSADVATRIAEVVEAELRHQVAEARRRLDAEVDERLRRLRESTDSLLERAARVSDELDGLAAALHSAATDASATAHEPLGVKLNGDTAPTVVSPAPVDTPAPAPATASAIDELEAELAGAAPATVIAAEPPPEEQLVPAGQAPSDAARLVAVEMALAGSSRDDVDRHLRSAYDVADTGDLLDDVFGR